MFETKSEEELKKMTAEELAGYYKALNDHNRQELEKKINEKASKDDIAVLEKTISENLVKQLETLNDALKEQGLAIARVAKKDVVEAEKSIKDFLSEGNEALKSLKKSRSSDGLNFEVKVAGTMTFGNSVTGEVPQAQREPGVNRIQDRRTYMRGLITSSTATSNVISWVEQQNRDGAVGGTAEGAVKNQIDFDLVVVSENIKKRTAFIKVSKEMLDDIDFLNSEINTELMVLLELDLDNQIANGDDIGENLNGIINSAEAWAAGPFAATVDNANNWDVLQVGINQIVENNFFPTSIVMRPSDITAMKLEKGSDGHYVLPPFIAANGMEVDGVRIVGSTVMAADDFLIMDGSKAGLFMKENIMIDIGYENDDFTRNLVTILGEYRALLRIKGNHTGAFVTGDFTTAKAALETP